MDLGNADGVRYIPILSEEEFAFFDPDGSAGSGMWWSEHDGVWLNVDQICARGPMADTLTSYEP